MVSCVASKAFYVGQPLRTILLSITISQKADTWVWSEDAFGEYLVRAAYAGRAGGNFIYSCWDF